MSRQFIPYLREAVVHVAEKGDEGCLGFEGDVQVKCLLVPAQPVDVVLSPPLAGRHFKHKRYT